MLIRILLIGFFIFKFFPLKAQHWNLNQTVFQGNYLSVADSVVFIDNTLGYWISLSLGESFQYKKFEDINGINFKPSSYIYSEKNSFPDNMVVEFNSTPPKYYDFVEINHSLDSFKRMNTTIKRSFNQIYNVFDKIICTKTDSIFKFNRRLNTLSTLNVLNSGNNFSYVNWVGELKFPSTYYLKRQSGKIHFVQSDTNFISSLPIFSFPSIGFSISIPSKKTFVLGGDNGQIYLSGDSAKTFKNISIGLNFPISVNFYNDALGIAYKSTFQNGRNLYFTYNAGEDWLEVELPKDLINVKGAAIKNNRVLVLGFDTVYQQTRLYQTDDITKHTVINTIKGGQPAPIGLPESVSQSNINIYPNPTNQFFTIETIETPKSIQLFNAVGQLVFTITPTHKTEVIDVAQLPKGLYFVKIQPQNDESLLKKIVVY